ncbi:MAG: IS200/IS605 family transposase [Candidatus Binatia bacterium]
MPQSLANVLVHLIFSTKNREPVIPHDLTSQLHGYIVGILDNLGCPSIQTGGTRDHVHVLFLQSRTLAIAKVVEEVKKISSKWMKGQGVSAFTWQAGYAVFSVSESQKAAVVSYIQRQEAHHRRVGFQEEMREFLVRHGVSYDERYIWD